MTEFWRFGGTPVPAAEVGAIAQRLESEGWDGLSVGEDAAVIAEPYVFLAAAAAATTRLKFGTAVSVPLRDPVQAASATATLQAISGGRFSPSFGRGDGGLALLGKAPISVKDFKEYVSRVQAYLAHEVVDVDEFPSTMKRLYETDPSIDAVTTTIDVSATGPKMVAWAATHVDGITFAVGAHAERLKDCIECARAARREAGLDPNGIRYSAYVPAAVVVDGFGRESARNIIRGAVLRHARFSAFEGTPLGDVDEADRETVLRAFDATRDHGLSAPKPADFSVASVIDDDFLERFAVVGEPRECAERFQELAELGIDRFVLLTRVPTTDPEERNTSILAQELLPLLT